MNITQIKELYSLAVSNRSDLDEDLRDAYRLFLPQEYYGSGLSGESSSNYESENLDATGSDALEYRSAEITNLLFPVYDKFVEFEKDGGLRIAELEDAQEKFHNVLQDTNFYEEVPLVIRSALVSTGCLEVRKTMNPDSPISFKAIPTWNVYPLENSQGKLDKVFIKNILSVDEAKTQFGKYINIDDLAQNQKVHLVEFYHMRPDGSIDYYCFAGGNEIAIRDGILIEYKGVRDRRLIMCRYGRTIGRAFGVGIAMRALPIARQINYLTSLSNEDLERSFGGWITFDFDEIPPSFFQEGNGVRMVHKPDGVDAPEMMQFQYKFNENNFKLEELRSALTYMIQGPGLPPVESSVRSATEIDKRVLQRQALIVPKTMNLFNELERPLVEVVLAVLRDEAIADSPYFIPSPPGIKYKPINRFANLEGKVKAAEIHQTLLMALQVDPNGEFRDSLDMEALMKHFLMSSGISKRFFRSEEEIEQFKLQKQADIEKLAELQVGANSPPVAPSAGVAPAQFRVEG